MRYDKYPSPLGTLWLYGSAAALVGVSFRGEFCESAEPAQAGEFDPVRRWLDAYFRGEPAAPDFALEPEGTDFQKLVWQQLLKIPFGQTRTYGWMAREVAALLGKEKMSPQAVGQAVGRNPIAIIIPCHRIIGAGGELTGYASGLHRKRWLLEHEQK